jgi:hypothetical protein
LKDGECREAVCEVTGGDYNSCDGCGKELHFRCIDCFTDRCYVRDLCPPCRVSYTFVCSRCSWPSHSCTPGAMWTDQPICTECEPTDGPVLWTSKRARLESDSWSSDSDSV